MAFKYAQCMIFQGSWLWYWLLSGGCKSWRNIGSK